jgi:hypothetical protein
MASELDPTFVRMLACPVTRQPVEQQGEWLVCRGSDPPRRYPIRDGIPVMLATEAQILTGEEWAPAPQAD